MARPLFRYTPRDAWPALSGVAILALHVVTFVGQSRWPFALRAAAFLGLAYSYWWNLQCISHNFIHNPFFNSRWLNQVYGIVLSLDIGVPQVIYHHYHMNHHAGDNDKRGPDGTTKDWSSIYRYSCDDNPEPFWRYCLIGYFRAELGPPIKKAAQQGHIPQLIAETIVLVSAWGLMLWFNWRYALAFYLPSYYMGWVLSYAQGYWEHYDAKPGDHYANSVSSYHRLYNLLWFNNGYHQEHHWDPKHHWTRMHQLHERLRPRLIEHGTRLLRGPHCTAFLEDWLNGRRWRQRSSDQPPRAKAA